MMLRPFLFAGAALLLSSAAHAQATSGRPAQPQSRPGVTEPDAKAPAPAVQPPGGSAAPS